MSALLPRSAITRQIRSDLIDVFGGEDLSRRGHRCRTGRLDSYPQRREVVAIGNVDDHQELIISTCRPIRGNQGTTQVPGQSRNDLLAPGRAFLRQTSNTSFALGALYA